MSSKAVILADGSFPDHEIPLGYLRNSEHTICCDRSAENLVRADLMPEAIVGDLDSLDTGIAERFADRLYKDSEQDTNDLTKAVKWCINKRYKEIVILGATGNREDHTICNISLLAEYHFDFMCAIKLLSYNPKLKELARKLRKNSTLAEVILWQNIKGKVFEYEFHRQVPINEFIVDFFCHELKLAIEIDGKTHDYNFENDKSRQMILESLGIKIIRFDDNDV